MGLVSLASAFCPGTSDVFQWEMRMSLMQHMLPTDTQGSRTSPAFVSPLPAHAGNSHLTND